MSQNFGDPGLGQVGRSGRSLDGDTGISIGGNVRLFDFSEADQTVDRRNIVRPSMKTMERKRLCETKHAAGCTHPFSVA